MKKLLLTAMAGVGVTLSANAQLPNGSVFPNIGVFYDISGGSHNIYTDLNAGKTVFIDVSATWCPPCWAYHMTDALDNLEKDHGPSGSMTQDVAVYFFQGETTSGLNELYGRTTGGSIVTTGESDRAHDTQGNWTVNSGGSVSVTYPIIDDSNSSSNPVASMAIAYFPTVYMICRDRIVHVLTQPTEAAAYAAAGTCPTYAPSAAVDAKPTAYAGSNYFYCSTPGSGTTAPQVTFQNYSTTPLSAATITIKDAASGTVVSTYSWTGSLASYAVATVTMPAFTGTASFFYNVNVNATGDAHPENNNMDTVIGVYDPLNAQSLPYYDGMGSWLTPGTGPSYKYVFDANGWNFPCNGISTSSTTYNVVGPDGGSTDTCLVYWFLVASQSYGYASVNSPFLLGNYNVTSASAISFDLSYEAASAAAVSGGTTDQLEVQVSSDCGGTWQTAWTGSGSTLVTNTSYPAAGSFFIPAAASDWKEVFVPLNHYASNDLLIRLTGISSSVAYTSASSPGNGEFIYVDNIRIKNTLAVTEVNTQNEISMYPNPAHDVVNFDINLAEATTVSVTVYDAVGRVVSSTNQELTAGIQKIELSTEAMATGVYNVKIAAGNAITTKQLSVVK